MPRLPTRLPTPVPSLIPRAVRRKGPNFGSGTWIGRIFILPHTLIGIGCIFYIFMLIAWMIAGTETRGRIIKKYTETGDDSTSYKIRYTYTINDKTREDTTTLDKEHWDRVEEAALEADDRSSVRVRYLPVGPWVYSHALTDVGSTFGPLGFALVFGGFWNAITGVFFYLLWIAPYRGRGLYRRGLAVPGVIVNVDHQRRRVEYEFESAGHPRRGRMKYAAGSPSVNEPVTVLHKPGNPSKSVVYEYGKWECVGP